MKLKTIKSSHFANYREAWDANQLVCEGKILPPLSAVYPLDQTIDALNAILDRKISGKVVIDPVR